MTSLSVWMLVILTNYGSTNMEFYSEKACNTALVKIHSETPEHYGMVVACVKKGE